MNGKIIEVCFVFTCFVFTCFSVYYGLSETTNPETTHLLLTDVSSGGMIEGIQKGVQQISSRKEPVKQTRPKQVSTNPSIKSGDGKLQGFDSEHKESISTIIHTGFPRDSIKQQFVNYAYKIGGDNLMYLIICENGGLDLDLQSRVQQSYGREQSYGLCQLGLPRKGVDKKRFLTDYKYQLDTCWKYRSTGTKFYGPERMVKGEKCYKWASKQIIFSGN